MSLDRFVFKTDHVHEEQTAWIKNKSKTGQGNLLCGPLGLVLNLEIMTV